jgi:ssDNA-binding Zn-finger/Zn-ribbon topoisomerase 1
LKHAEEHMTDVKRMEKPTDLTCEKCGKPLVIKWGKHGSFFACTGYPGFSHRSTESDLEKLESYIAERQASLRKKHEKELEKYPEVELKWDASPKLLLRPGFPEAGKGLKARLANREKMIATELEKLRDTVEVRLGNILGRYPQMKDFYDLDLTDTAEGIKLVWKRREELCTYTRELPVDLADIDKANLSDQGDEEYCVNCGRPMVLKKGRFGSFFACSGYPDCKTTKQIGGGAQKKDQPLDEKCPQCDNNLVMKHGRFGEFTACSNYPTCKYVKQKTIGVKCPECTEGEVVERRSKRGKTFYGCNRYPDCNFVAWGKPIAEKCPECGSPYMTEKWLKAGTFWQCPNPECKHKQEAPPETVAPSPDQPQPEPAEVLAH